MKTVIEVLARYIAIAGWAFAALALAGCAGDGQRRKPDASLQDLEPVQIQLTLGLPSDSDGNGYPDTVHAMAYLFPDSRYSDQPVSDTGTFYFEMHNASGQLAAQWVFPPEIVEQAERRMPAGPAYSMYVRLAEGADRMPPSAMDIRVQFLSETGTRVRSTGRTTVRLGG